MNIFSVEMQINVTDQRHFLIMHATVTTVIVNIVYVGHSRPQSPRSFWSAPRIETSGRDQVKRKRNSCPFL